MGTVVLAAIAVVFLNLAVDMVYVLLDPRIRLKSS
jgi:ABC-type dipeptide/oligopeptide/nickel transport system permease component